MVHVTKFYLLYQEQEELPYQQFCEAMFQIERDVRAYKNLASSEAFHDIVQQMNWKEIHGAYPKKTDLEDAEIIPVRNRLYTMAASMIPTLQSGNASSISEDVNNYFTSHKKDIMAGRTSIPSYKSGQPIRFSKKNIFAERREGKRYLKLSVFSRLGTQSLGLKPHRDIGLGAGQCLFEAWHKCDSSIAILDRCIDGEYEICASQLKYDSKKRMWEFALSYKFDSPKTVADRDKVLGIDMGIRNPIALATNFDGKRWFFHGGEIETFRAKTEAMRREMSRARVQAGDGSVGHGRTARTKAVDRIGNRIANFRNTKNHAWSREVIKIAVKNGCGTIQMEDLSGITAGKRPQFLKDWTYFDLQSKIKYKAEEVGIAVVLVAPHYTSQRCSKCGYISALNLESYEKFVCRECGFEADADYNAARNIATPGIEALIAAQREKQQREPEADTEP
jgi:IS605 OrfB family transposase